MGELPTEWAKSNAIQRDILITLYLDGPATGARVHESRGEPPANESTTHRNLVALRERGLVEADTDDDDGRAYVNSLTDEGTRLVEQYKRVINA